jgi:hypothetical protein
MLRRAIAVVSALLICTSLSAETVNVREFGAKGDGKSDDTKAIQEAFNAAAKKGIGGRFGANGAYYGSSEVVFPVGAYVISDGITVGVNVVRGEGDPSIRQTDPEKDIFYYPNAWHGKVSGITFLGGKTHLNLGNGNIDTGHFSVMDCKFHHSSGPAMLFRKGSNSTFFIIKDCLVTWCMQALVSYTDWTTLRDTWITSHHKMDNMAVIENYGFMTLDNLLGVPLCTGVDQRWVDNHGSLHCFGCRFGGEGGGFTPVVNFAKYSPQAGGNLILIDDSVICAQSNFKRKCAVYCEEIPNSIDIRNSTIYGIPPIKVDREIDLETYFRGARPGMLSYKATNSIGEFAMDIPELLKNPIIEDGEKAPQLSEEETRAALAQAVKEVAAREWPPFDAGAHALQTDPENYIEIAPEAYTWDLTDYMDATREPNGEYLAVTQAGDDIVILKRRAERWPHVLIKNVTVDLDKYPNLVWRLKDAKDGPPNSHAARVIDTESERMVALCEVGHGVEFQRYNVKEKLGVSGVRTLDIRFYYLGYKYIAPTKDKTFAFEIAEPGEYMILDFIRFEAE